MGVNGLMQPDFYGFVVTGLRGSTALDSVVDVRFVRDINELIIWSTVGEGTTGEASAEDMPPLEGEEGDDPSKMEEVD